MLDAVVDFLPSPVDLPPTQGTKPGKDEVVERKPDDDEPFSALAFKIMTDPYVGKLTYLRVYSGTLDKGDTVINTTKGIEARAPRAAAAHAREQPRRPRHHPHRRHRRGGRTQAGHDRATPCRDPNQPIQLETLTFPEPVIHVAVEPKTKADQEKLGKALYALSEEDPTFRVRTDQETGQTVISGMGELHLEVLVDRMLREFSVDANVGKPQVAYRETIRKKVEKVEEKYVRQTGGKGQYGHVVITVEPTGPGGGYEFLDEITRWRHPQGVHPAGQPGHHGGAHLGRPGRVPGGRPAGAPHLR